MSYGKPLFRCKQSFLTEIQEKELLNDLELQKKRLESISQIESVLAIEIVRSVEKNLKQLFSDSKCFKDVRSAIGKYLATKVIPTLSKLSENINSEEQIFPELNDTRSNDSKNFKVRGKLGKCLENMAQSRASSLSEKRESEKETLFNNSNVRYNFCSTFSQEKESNVENWQHEFVGIVKIKDNDRGLPFEKIFTKDKIGKKVTQIRVEDPYLITKEQNMVLYNFILAMKHTYNCLEYVEIKTKLMPGCSDIYKELLKKFPKLSKNELMEKERKMVEENLNYVKTKWETKGVEIKITFGDASMHERRILFNSGVIAHSGRGLSIYYLNYYKYGGQFCDLPCKECNILIVRLKGWNIDIHDLSHIK